MDEVVEVQQDEMHFSAQKTRFCGRCQSDVPAAVAIHVCKKAPRLIGYAWYEPDEPAIEKNSIIQYSKPFKPGELIESRPAQVAAEDDEHDKRNTA